MGHWGVKILENDAASDLMLELKSGSCEFTTEFVESLLRDSNLDYKLLGVAFVDMAITKTVHSDIWGLGELEFNNDLINEIMNSIIINFPWPPHHLRELSIDALKYIQSNDYYWKEDCVQKRKLLLDTLAEHLKF